MKAKIPPIAGAAALLTAVLAASAYGAVACGATGTVTGGQEGLYTYAVSVTWDFLGAGVPEEIDILLPTLDGCEFYNPGNPIQSRYVVPVSGVSLAQPGCLDSQCLPTSEIAWVGAVRLVDEYCWINGIHVEYTNSGETENCMPLTADTGVFTFESYGVPVPSAVYYDAIVMRVGDVCVVCDYEGPIPDCNMWAPVETMRWGTIKALYR